MTARPDNLEALLEVVKAARQLVRNGETLASEAVSDEPPAAATVSFFLCSLEDTKAALANLDRLNP